MKILVVEDEPRMADLLVSGLREESHDVQLATDGRAALNFADRDEFDVVLLDVMLPGLNGYEVAKELRLRRVETPVLMLTARDAIPDVVHGLDVGADDYMTKPFSFAELLARLRAVGRRASKRKRSVLEVEDLVLDTSTQRAFRSGQELHLSLTEFRLLELLARHKGQVVSRHTILDTVWGHRRGVEENTLDAFVRLLRKKVDQGAAARLIQTHRGFGYSVGLPEAA
jgi:DNA-binding response OmpR family regulator